MSTTLTPIWVYTCPNPDCGKQETWTYLRNRPPWCPWCGFAMVGEPVEAIEAWNRRDE